MQIVIVVEMLAIVIATVPVVASLHASTFAALRSQMCLPASTFELPTVTF